MNTPFELPVEVNIYSVLETRQAMLAWFDAQSGKSTDILAVCARGVIEVDGAGLQLLAALGNMGQRWRLVEASPVFVEACRTMGFGHWLDANHLNTLAVKAAAP